jgi:hypothetical protein
LRASRQAPRALSHRVWGVGPLVHFAPPWKIAGYSASEGEAMAETEVFRTAYMLMHLNGENAEFAAHIRADEYRARGDSDSERLWLKVRDAVRVLMPATRMTTRH